MPDLQWENCSCKEPQTVIVTCCDIKSDCAKDMETETCDTIDCDNMDCDTNDFNNMDCDTIDCETIDKTDCDYTEKNGNNTLKEAPRNDYKLLNVTNVPDYAKEMSITTGYRTTLDYNGCFRSIFWLHNETVNIWTHLLGFFFFLWLMVDNLTRPQDHIRDLTDYLATAIQLITYQV